MLTILLLAILLISVGLWNYASQVNIHIEHHPAEVHSKKELPQHEGEMMYFYRHGFLGDPSFNYIPPSPTHEVSIKTHFEPTPSILNFNHPELFHQLDHGEKVSLEVRKIIRTNRFTKKSKHSYHPVSILKNNGQKIKI